MKYNWEKIDEQSLSCGANARFNKIKPLVKILLMQLNGETKNYITGLMKLKRKVWKLFKGCEEESSYNS